jgi:hypothetical protein
MPAKIPRPYAREVSINRATRFWFFATGLSAFGGIQIWERAREICKKS